MLFSRIGQNAKTGKTNVLMPVAKGSVASNPQGARFREISDGLHRTALAIEVPTEASVIWTKPSDFDVEIADVVTKVVGKRKKFCILFADGSVREFTKTTNEQLKAMFTMSGKDSNE